MKIVVFLTIVLYFYLVESHNVIKLTKNDYQSFLNSHPNVLVKYFAPWCGHCKKLAPEYERASDIAAAAGLPISLAEVDCTEEEDVCSKNSINGYPTLKVFKNGLFSEDYNGPRDANGIVKYMEARSKPPSTEFASMTELENLLSEDKPTISVYIKSADNEFTKKYLAMASQLFTDALLIHTHNSVFETSEDKYIRMYLPKSLRSKFEPDFTVYKGDFNTDNIRNWIQDNGHGSVGYRLRDNQFYHPDSNLLVVYSNSSFTSYGSGVKYVRNRILKAVTKNKDKFKGLKFAYSPSDEFAHELGEYGFDMQTTLPVARIMSSDGKKYKLEKYSVENLEKFVNDFLSGSLTAYLKSEPIKTDQTTAVKHVVALNFDQIVNDPTKDVLVVFHAEWCGHCKALMPKYEQAAELLKDEKNIALVAMNAVQNDVPKLFEVSGFPTIYYVSKSKKSSPIPYQGGREVDDIIKYMAKEASEELQKYDRLGNLKKSEL